MTEKVDTVELKPCPFCAAAAKLMDHRLSWSVHCTSCTACVLGERAPEPHGDGESDDATQDAQAREMAANTDWDYYKQTAVTAWNRREGVAA